MLTTLSTFIILFAVNSSAQVVVKTSVGATYTNLMTQEKGSVGKDTMSISSTAPYLFESPQKVPVVVVPYSAGNPTNVAIEFPSLENECKGTLGASAASDLSYMMLEINLIQNLLKSNRAAEARSHLNRLEKLYPKVSFLKFISASVLVVEGKRKEAVSALKDGLLAHPDYEPGQRMLKQLE